MYKVLTQKLWLPPCAMSKLLLIMRLTTLILITAILQVSAVTYGQRVTLSARNKSLAAVLEQIRSQTGYDFLYKTEILKATKNVSIQVENADLKDVLNQLLKPQHLEYALDNRSVIISREKRSFLDRLVSAFTAIDVSGKVINDQGMPIPGATVMIKGGSRGTTTDKDGKFSLLDVDEKAVLTISSVGFLTKELNVKPDLGTIALEISNARLDEVMVIGYGTTTRRLSTGSSSQVKGGELTQQPISNPILGLEGRITGAFITQTAGYAGATMKVIIRGQNSLQAQTNNITDPLYIIDGIPFGSTPVEQSIGGFGVAFAFSPLNTIDPTQIENITVLKDADATAIYGSRGANGVVLITTKKGKAGSTKVDVDLSSGFGSASNKIKMLSTDQYLKMRREAFANDNITPNATNAPDLTLWSPGAYTDFPDLLMGNTQHQTKATFSVSGGDQYTQFLFGGNYRHESTVLKSNTADNAVQFHTSAQHSSRNNKFGISTSVSYNVDNNTVPNYTLSTTNYGLPPNYPLYNGDGSLYFGPGYTNPLAAFNSNYNVKSDNLVTNINLHYMVLPGLDFKINAGYNYINTFASTVQPPSALNPANNFLPSTTMSNNFIKTYIAEPQINYTHTWGKGKLTALLGGTWQETRLIQPYFVIGTFTNVQLATSLTALTILAKSSNSSDYKYDSGFARVEYEWDGKYLVSGNFRRDGSSRFGTSTPYGTFGSGAVAWIFSKENFIAGKLPWLSFGKLKASYGVVGNDKTLADYAYLSTYNAGTGYGPYSSLAPARIQNPHLQWEVNKKFDAAADLGFLDDRIFVSAGVFRNRANRLLANIAIPSQAGFNSYSGNLPDGAVVQNQGFEFELSTVNFKNKAFSWNSSFNFTASQNKLLSFPNILSSNYASTLVVGQSLNLRTLYHSTGIVNGIPTAQDVNGDGNVTGGLFANNRAGDRIVSGNNDPQYYGGLNNTFSYKGFQLDFLFQFVKRTATRGDQNFVSYPGLNANLPESYLDVPLKYSATFGSAALNAFQFYQGSDATVEDASYIRLKNVSLAYNVPLAWSKKLKMSGLQFYIHGQNLLTITNYKGLDPETLTNQVPPLRMIVAGIKTTF